MSLWQPTRRQFIRSAPLALGAALARPNRAWASPGGDPLRFIVLGDWGRRGKYQQRQVADVMRATDARFIVTTGDNFYNWGVGDKQASHWRESYVDVYHGLLAKPWFPALGNHDYTGNPVAQLGGYEGTGWWMPARNYIIKGSLFGHPQVDLFIADITMWEGGNGFPQGLFGKKPPKDSLPAVRRWLAEELAQSRAPIKLVFGHHAIYSVGSHGGARERVELLEVLKSGGATAYVHGHDHCLFHIRDSHLDYICSGGGSKIDTAKDYTGGGAWGCVLAEQCPKLADGGYAAPPRGSPEYLHYERSAGFALFEVWPSRVDFSFRGPNLQRPYHASIPARALPAPAAI